MEMAAEQSRRAQSMTTSWRERESVSPRDPRGAAAENWYSAVVAPGQSGAEPSGADQVSSDRGAQAQRPQQTERPGGFGPAPPRAAEAHSAVVLADVIDRLCVIFESVDVRTVIRVVRGCRRELDILSGQPRPEVLQALAHDRLTAWVHRGHEVGVGRRT